MKIEIELKETSNKLTHDNVENAYIKGVFYCVYIKSDNCVFKYPIDNIFRVRENYVSINKQDTPND